MQFGLPGGTNFGDVSKATSFPQNLRLGTILSHVRPSLHPRYHPFTPLSHTCRIYNLAQSTPSYYRSALPNCTIATMGRPQLPAIHCNHPSPRFFSFRRRVRLYPHYRLSLISSFRATALYNAVKKQFGLHSYLLPLALPRKPPPPPVPVPALLPRLPPPPTSEHAPKNMSPTPAVPTNHSILNTISMAETDIQQTARFTREFVVMSLLPWMEKCVLEWNENVRSARELCIVNGLVFVSFQQPGDYHHGFFLLRADYSVRHHPHRRRRLSHLLDLLVRYRLLRPTEGLCHLHKRVVWQSLQLSWATSS